MKTIESLLSEIKEIYNLDLNYFSGYYDGHLFKLRFNKDHARNFGRNDDESMSNLSLINTYGNGASEVNFYSNNDKVIQSQKWGILDWTDAEKEIVDFLNELTWLD